MKEHKRRNLNVFETIFIRESKSESISLLDYILNLLGKYSSIVECSSMVT